MDRIKNDLTVLAHDSMQGRKSGTEGEKKAARYITQKFREAGLTPLFPDSGFCLHFRYYFYPAIWDSKLVINGHEFINHTDFFTYSNSSEGNPNAALVYAGYGIQAPELGYSDYKPGTNYRNKIFILDISLPGGYSRNSRFYKYMNLDLRINAAVKMGAKGVILVNPDDHCPDISSVVTSLFYQPAGVPVVFLREKFENLKNADGLRANIFVKNNSSGLYFMDVAGMIDNHAKQTIAITAHYDHIGTKTRNYGNTRYVFVNNGADDNASGTAGIIEIARYIKAKGLKDKNYVFIAFSAEEDGLVGSKAFVYYGFPKMLNIVATINLDMIGRMDSLKRKVEVFGTGTCSEWNELLKSIPCKEFKLRKWKGDSFGSDNQSFYRSGIPALFFNTGLHKDYHKPSDESERINYPGEAYIVNYIEKLLEMLDPVPETHFRKVSGFWPDLVLFMEQMKFL